MLTNNPKRYRELLEPFPTRDAAEAAMHSFFADLDELRVKHRIVTVLGIVEVNVVDETEPLVGGEACMQGSIIFGNLAKAPLLAAILYGSERRKLEALLDSAAGSKKGN